MYCYGRIVWVLTRRIDSKLDKMEISPQRNCSDNKMQTVIKDKFQLARQNTIKTFLLVGLCFIICWSNDQIFFLMFNLGYDVDFNGIYYKFGVLMVFLNCTLNPFIYLLKYRLSTCFKRVLWMQQGRFEFKTQYKCYTKYHRCTLKRRKRHCWHVAIFWHASIEIVLICTHIFTRLHSSRMHTARLFTVSHSMHCAGSVPGPGGVCFRGDAWSWGGGPLEEEAVSAPGGCLLQWYGIPGGHPCEQNHRHV